jgi:uncharacterized protein
VSPASRRAGTARISVRVTPRAASEAIAGVRDGALVVRVTAAPVDGAANAAVARLIAAALGVPVGRVSVLVGGSGRRKIVGIEGLDRAAVAARWPDLGV